MSAEKWIKDLNTKCFYKYWEINENRTWKASPPLSRDSYPLNVIWNVTVPSNRSISFQDPLSRCCRGDSPELSCFKCINSSALFWRPRCEGRGAAHQTVSANAFKSKIKVSPSLCIINRPRAALWMRRDTPASFCSQLRIKYRKINSVHMVQKSWH